MAKGSSQLGETIFGQSVTQCKQLRIGLVNSSVVRGMTDANLRGISTDMRSICNYTLRMTPEGINSLRLLNAAGFAGL